MGLKIPDKPKDEQKKPRAAAEPKQDAVQPLMVGDTIEYSLTEEVSPGPGRKAWIKAGTTSTVREGESSDEATRRVTDYVENLLDERIEQAGRR